MHKSIYEIVSTKVSRDKKNVYCIFKESVMFDSYLSVTHGISAANLSSTEFVRDVYTNPVYAEGITESLAANSIPPEGLRSFIENNID